MSEARAQHRGERLWVCAPRLTGFLWCLCVSILRTPVCVCVSVSSPRRGDLPITQASCPLGALSTSAHNTGLPSPEPSRVHTPGPLCPIRIQATVSQALPPPVCAGLRPWWLHCKGRDNVPCPVDTHPRSCRALFRLPGTYVLVTYPLYLGCQPQLSGFQVQIQECSAVGPPSLEASDSTPGSMPPWLRSAGHFLMCLPRPVSSGHSGECAGHVQVPPPRAPGRHGGGPV